MTDEGQLIARAQRGDLRAYEALVQRYEQLAFRTAYCITRDEGEAADVAQEALLRAYRALKSFQLGRAWRPWLLRIVTTQALNRAMATKRRERMVERYTQQVLTRDDAHSHERTVHQRERSERLRQAMRRLSTDEQALIALRYFLELPEGEVAALLNIPPGTVKSCLHRTLTKLRSVIRRDFPDLSDLTLETDIQQQHEP